MRHSARMSTAAPPLARPERVAAIDLGSNSARVVVVEVEAGGHLEVVEELRTPLRLALALGSDGRLPDDAVAATLAALHEFMAVARGAGAQRIEAVATAALRDARNADAILAPARQPPGPHDRRDRRASRGGAVVRGRDLRPARRTRAAGRYRWRQHGGRALPRPRRRGDLVVPLRRAAHVGPVLGRRPPGRRGPATARRARARRPAPRPARPLWPTATSWWGRAAACATSPRWTATAVPTPSIVCMATRSAPFACKRCWPRSPGGPSTSAATCRA